MELRLNSITLKYEKVLLKNKFSVQQCFYNITLIELCCFPSDDKHQVCILKMLKVLRFGKGRIKNNMQCVLWYFVPKIYLTAFFTYA